MSTPEKTRAPSTEGAVWKVTDAYRWQITLSCMPDGKRVTRGGRAPSREAATNSYQQTVF